MGAYGNSTCPSSGVATSLHKAVHAKARECRQTRPISAAAVVCHTQRCLTLPTPQASHHLPCRRDRTVWRTGRRRSRMAQEARGLLASEAAASGRRRRRCLRGNGRALLFVALAAAALTVSTAGQQVRFRYNAHCTTTKPPLVHAECTYSKPH